MERGGFWRCREQNRQGAGGQVLFPSSGFEPVADMPFTQSGGLRTSISPSR